MPDGVVDDVTDVGVGKLVGDLGTAPGGSDEAGLAQDLEVLGKQWLAHHPPGGLERGLQFMDATRPFSELDDRGQADCRRKGLEQIHCAGQPVRHFRIEHCEYISCSLYKQQAIDPSRVSQGSVFATIPDTAYRYLKLIQTSCRGSVDLQHRRTMFRFAKMASGTVLLGAVLMAAGWVSSSTSAAASGTSTVAVVAGENQYGNVASQVGGKYVRVYSVDSNPNVDPHTYEATPSVGQKIAQANLLIENGVGYDTFMGTLASASPNSARKVINVQHLLGLPGSTANPHLWYDPKTMPAVAKALASDLSALDPAHASTFYANEAKFVASLQPWLNAIAAFRANDAGTTAATTEPVADYLLTAMGIKNLTPWQFQADIMNGTDPTPQDVSLEQGFFTKHQVKVFCYNEQVTDPLTDSVRQNALAARVPVVGVYETMPVPGYDYQTWMMAELNAIKKAITTGVSTQHL